MANLNILRANLIDCFTAYCNSIAREVEMMYPDGKLHGTREYERVKIERTSPKTGRKLTPRYECRQIFELNTPEWRSTVIAERINRLTQMPIVVEPTDSYTYILLKGNTEDTFFSDENITRIVNRIPEKYRDHLIGFRVGIAHYFSIVESFGYALPVFEGEFDEMFWDEHDKYIADKARFCSMYGCD